MNTKRTPPWQAVGPVIRVTTGIVLFYLMSVLLHLPLGWILGLLLSSILATVWMVIRILKDTHPTDKTFDEYFYQDRPDLRRNTIKNSLKAAPPEPIAAGRGPCL
jgi:hypothetical protein